MLPFEEILAESVRATGTRALPLNHMMSVLEAGHKAGLRLVTVDVENSDRSLPLPEWMFRLTDREATEMRTEQIVPAALDFYSTNAADPELRQAMFLIYFETAHWAARVRVNYSGTRAVTAEVGATIGAEAGVAGGGANSSPSNR